MGLGHGATRIKAALEQIGIPRSQVRAHTVHADRRWTDTDGKRHRCSEPLYGTGSPRERDGVRLVAEHAEALAAQGFGVRLTSYPCGCLISASLDTQGTGRVETRTATTEHRRCPTGPRAQAVARALAEHLRGTSCQETALKWFMGDFSPEDVTAWLDAGCDDPSIARFLCEAGVTPAAAMRVVTAADFGPERTGTVGELAARRHLSITRFHEFTEENA